MHQFKDNEKRAWDVSINVAAVKRVRSLLKVDIYRLVEDKLRPLGELLGDICLFVDVLYLLSQPHEKTAQPPSDEDFGRALAGDALQDATDAFLMELEDFFPGQTRKILKEIRTKGREAADLAMRKVEEEMRRLTPESMLEAMEQQASPNGSSGATRGSAGSTPAPSPSESST